MSPVELSDLPVGNLSLSNDPTAVLLMRTGLTDYQIAVAIIRNINLQALQTLPNGTPIQSDLMLVNRIVSGVATNFQVTFGQVGFPVGTVMWFYNSLPPTPNWSVVANTGNRLLAVSDGTTNYNSAVPGSQSGTWQQEGVNGGTPGGGLTIAQMPSHTHTAVTQHNTNNSDGNRFAANQSRSPRGSATTDPTGGVNPANASQSMPHNHGNTWRPMANVGILGRKAF
jgi:hypothetical protein